MKKKNRVSEWDKTQQQLLTTSSQTISLAEEQRPLNGGRRRKQVATEWAGRWKGSEEPDHADWSANPVVAFSAFQRIYIYIFNDPSREPYQTVSTVYSLKKDGKERGAKNGEITYDELDFWAD